MKYVYICSPYRPVGEDPETELRKILTRQREPAGWQYPGDSFLWHHTCILHSFWMTMIRRSGGLDNKPEKNG